VLNQARALVLAVAAFLREVTLRSATESDAHVKREYTIIDTEATCKAGGEGAVAAGTEGSSERLAEPKSGKYATGKDDTLEIWR
jgi:hypothetical protein